MPAAFLHHTALHRRRGAPPKRPQKSVHWLLVERLHLSSSSTIAAKTVVAVACPGEGNDPIFTEVVESKSSVNLSAPTAAPIHYAKHYPTIPSPHPIHPTIPSKQQSLNKSNICSLKQALEEYCSATIIVRISVFTQNSQHLHHCKLSCWKHRELSNDTRRMSQNGQISKCQLETSKRCHLELQDAWTPLDKFCIDKAEKALSITKILADILSLNYKDICGFLSQIFYAVLFAAGFTAGEL